MYTINKVSGGYRLTIYSQGLRKSFKVAKYIYALQILQTLGLHLKQTDRLLAA